MYKRKDGTMLDDQQLTALVLTETGVRNSILEELHVGISPNSATGDYSDVKVVTPYGEIPWNKLSRINNEEMKRLMIDVVDRLYSIIAHPELMMTRIGRARETWKEPELHERFRKFLVEDMTTLSDARWATPSPQAKSPAKSKGREI